MMEMVTFLPQGRRDSDLTIFQVTLLDNIYCIYFPISRLHLLHAVHSHNTRGSGLNFVLTRELSLSQNGFAFTAIKHWNSLPSDLKSIDNIRVFKQRLKQFLFTRYD